MAKQAPILVADDDDNDVFFLRRAVAKAGLANQLLVTHDGQETIDYLGGAAPFNDRARYPMPGLLLLDLKMPRLDGFDVLAWLSTRPDLKDLPVIVLSSSSHEADMIKARQLGADDYQVKPPDFMTLVQLLRELHARWLGASSKPNSSAQPQPS